MGTFCRNCGKALADGEVCHCTDPVQTESTATEQTTNNIPTQPNPQQAQGNTQMPNMGGQFNQQMQNGQFNQQMPNMNQFNPNMQNGFNPQMQNMNGQFGQQQFNQQMPNMNNQFNPNMQNGQFNPNMQNQFNPNMQNRQFNPHMPNMNGMGNNFNNGFNSVKESGNLKGIICLVLFALGFLVVIFSSAALGEAIYGVSFIISALHIYKKHKMYGGQVSLVQYYKAMLTDKSNTPFLQDKVFALIIAFLPILIIFSSIFGAIQADLAADDAIDTFNDYINSLY
jgi:hypothetical protein